MHLLKVEYRSIFIKEADKDCECILNFTMAVVGIAIIFFFVFLLMNKEVIPAFLYK